MTAGNLFRSIRLLVTIPGLLTEEHIIGGRKLYIGPLQLFLIINLIYFLIQPVIGWNALTISLATHLNNESYSPLARTIVSHAVSKSGSTLAAFEEKFNGIVVTHAKSLVILMVPIFAFVLDLLYRRAKRYSVEHLFFSLHFYAFWLLLTTVNLILTNIVVQLLAAANFAIPWQLIDFISTLVQVGIIAGYLFFACRTVYKESPKTTFVKALGLTVAVVYLLKLYRFILFIQRCGRFSSRSAKKMAGWSSDRSITPYPTASYAVHMLREGVAL